MKLTTAARALWTLTDPSTLPLLRRTLTAQMMRREAECPCCGYRGKFQSGGIPARPSARCSSCQSRERHRLLKLAMDKRFVTFTGRDVLHFAPEPIVMQLADQQGFRSRITADIQPGRADRVLDIENIALPDASIDLIICSHVLEHVDDARALAEMRRALRPGGQIVIMVPIVEGWETSYEDAAITSKADRHQHFGQFDHIRYYGGLDFRRRVGAAGFDLSEFTAGGSECVRYSLQRGERVFLATKRQTN